MRSKLSYSNVVSTLCLFLLLGGGAAYAAGHLGKNSVGAKQLRKNSVTSPKVKDNSLTGGDINESTLETVPSATRAAPTGPAGGALNGTFPDPAIANGSIGPADLSFAPATQAELNTSRPFPVAGGSLATTEIESTCTSYAESALTVDAPSAGTVTLTANVWLQTFHTTGETDAIDLDIGTTPSDCGLRAGHAKYSIPAPLPTIISQDITLPVSRVVTVSAGPHTFYVDGQQSSGTDTENFFAEGMTAIFFPN